MRPRREAMMTTLLRKLKPTLSELDARHPVAKQAEYQVSDCVLSVLAMFVFKQPNLFRFEQEYRQRSSFLESLQQLFDISAIPSDTTIRRLLDPLPTVE